jgi:hypothetical protein
VSNREDNRMLRMRTILYTTAGPQFDGFSTIEHSAECGKDNRGLPIRRVSVEARDLDWQRGRYASGLHDPATQDQVDRFPSIWVLDDDQVGHCDGCNGPIWGMDDYRKGEEGMRFCPACVAESRAEAERNQFPG